MYPLLITVGFEAMGSPFQTSLSQAPMISRLVARFLLIMQIFMAVDQLWEAVKCATKATELKPSWAEGHLTLSRAQLEFGQVISVPSSTIWHCCHHNASPEEGSEMC